MTTPRPPAPTPPAVGTATCAAVISMIELASDVVQRAADVPNDEPADPALLPEAARLLRAAADLIAPRPAPTPAMRHGDARPARRRSQPPEPVVDELDLAEVQQTVTVDGTPFRVELVHRATGLAAGATGGDIEPARRAALRELTTAVKAHQMPQTATHTGAETPQIPPAATPGTAPDATGPAEKVRLAPVDGPPSPLLLDPARAPRRIRR